MGFELAAALVGFCLLGYWIDSKYDTAPWGLLICACLGLVGGMYNLVRTALSATAGPARKPPGKDSDKDGPRQRETGTRRTPPPN
jgi:F0F1-type ATP synthase assembly protein I